MNFVKACEEKFNIKTCDTIQLGTFRHYSEMDPKFSIADPKEGALIIDGFSHENGDHGQAVMESIGSPTMQNVTLNVGADKEGKKIGSVKPTFEYKNCFIFCMTKYNENETPEPEKISKEYDSYYLVKNNDIKNFAEYLLLLIHEQLTFDDIDFEKMGNPPIREFFAKPLELRYFSSDVQYKETKNLDANELTTIKEDPFIYAAFTKDKEKYSTDNEFRILFKIYHADYGLIPVKKEPKILNLKKINKLIA